MTESIYKEYQNKYYNPNDNDKKPGDNDNWKSIQKGFYDISEKQLETSAGLTLGKGTEDETSVTAAELEAMKQGGGDEAIYYEPVTTISGSGAAINAGAYSQSTFTRLESLNQVIANLRNKGFKSVRLFYKIANATAAFATYAVIDAIRLQDRDGNYFPDVFQTDKTATSITLTIHNTSVESITENYTIVIYVAPFSKTV